MADLVTHLASVMLPAVFIRHRAVGLVGVGVVLPDAISRVPGEALERAFARGWPVPELAVAPWGLLHEPIPLLCVCLLLALSFREVDRPAAFGALVLGCAAHLGLDVLQDHHGHGYSLLYPLSTATWEAGWIGSEATVRLAPWLGGVTALAWGIRRWTGQRVSAASSNTPSDTPTPPA